MQRKGGNLLFLFLQVARMNIVKERSGVSIKNICMENGRFLVVFDKRFGRLTLEVDILLRRAAEAWFVRVRDAKSLRR